MRCPACKADLVVVEREAIEVDWCPACRGIWFDAGELEILAAKAGKRLEPGLIGEASPDVREARRRCPRCRRRMGKAAVDGAPPILLDRCLRHGLWFDAGELGDLMARLSDRGGEGAVVAGFLGETFRGVPAAENSQQERSK